MRDPFIQSSPARAAENLGRRMLSEFAQRVLAGSMHQAHVQLWLVVEGDVIRQAAFRSPGCPSSSAVGEVLCSLISGRRADKVAELTADELMAVIGGLPEGKGHYMDRAIRALRAALSN